MTNTNSANIDAVLSLANHLQRMAQEAQQIAEELLPRSSDSDSRDYFTPTEDDRITHLWVSFIKARAALLEILTSLRSEFRETPADQLITKYAAEFLTGYTAAMVLVDAARTLRDWFAENKRVRRKLNESYEHYGIKADQFELIQRSLTRPEHALGVRQATVFFDLYADQFAAMANESSSIRELMKRIDELRHRIEVTASEYLKALAEDRAKQVSKQLIAGNAEKAIYAIQQWGSRLVSSLSTNPKHVSQLPDEIMGQLREILEPGDVLVTRKECAVTNYFLPGFWPHAAMYVGDEQVVESLKDGVRVRNMDSPFGNDCIAVIRPKLSIDEIFVAVQRAHSHVGKEYDFDFDFTRADRMVCSEVVYRSYEGLGELQFQLRKRAGRQTLSAQDLLLIAMLQQGFDPIALYCPNHSPKLCQAEQMREILRVTIGESPV